MLFVILAALVPFARAPQEGGSLPEGAQLLDRVHATFGDAERLEGARNLELRGKIAWEGMEGEGVIREVYAGLGKARLTSEFPGFGTFHTGSDGEVAYEENPLGVTVREGWSASQYMRVYGIVQHAPWRSMYAQARCTGTKEVNGVGCYELVLTPRALVEPQQDERELVPAPDVWYVAREGLRPVRIEVKTKGLVGEPSVVALEFSDWREVDGMSYPFTLRMGVSGFTMRTEYHSIAHDVELAAGHFELSEAVESALADARSGGAPESDAIHVETLEARHIASVRVTCKHAEMQKTMAVILPEAMRHVLSSGTAMAGQPLVRYHEFGDTIDMEAGIPVAGPVEPKGRVKAEVLPAGEAVIAWHVGPFDTLGETHEKVQAYVKEKGLAQRAPFWEEYWTDPGMEPDSSKWRTRIVFPVESAK